MIKQKYPDWFVWILDHGFPVVVLLVSTAMVAIVIVGYYVNTRLTHIEEKLEQRPPRSYQPPNLDEYKSIDISSESIALQRAVYVPIYSHVYYNRGRPYLLEATLSIRNTDIRRPVYIRSVRYYNTKGELVKEHAARLIRLNPLETIEFLVEIHDTTGGSGANYIVEWMATEEIDEPLIEAVMVGVSGTQGICFSRSGVPLTFSPPPAPGE